MFQITYGMFLAYPNTYWASMHGAVVGLFALNGLLYLAIIAWLISYQSIDKEKISMRKSLE